ncbi:MAG: ArsR/SmtB family transcription factor [Leptospirales bacterium]
MNEVLTLAQMARLIAVPSRAAMLLAMADGRALPASELAYRAGVSNQTASEHLALMKKMGVVCMEPCGRHRYYRVVTPQIMETLESLLASAPSLRLEERSDIARVTPLREARMCYDHLAGQLGVVLAEALQKKEWIALTGRDFYLTEKGHHLLGQSMGINWSKMEHSRRLFARRCIDWSERKPHIGGILGATLANRLAELDWIRHTKDSRAVYATQEGRKMLLERFGITC